MPIAIIIGGIIDNANGNHDSWSRNGKILVDVVWRSIKIPISAIVTDVTKIVTTYKYLGQHLFISKGASPKKSQLGFQYLRKKTKFTIHSNC